MEADIVFIGTGGDSFVISKQIRLSSGFVVRVDGLQFLVDPGPNSLCMMHHSGVNIRETTGIIVSHSHVNHANDLNAAIAGMTLNGADRQGVIVCSESVIRGTQNSHPVLNEFHRSCIERSIILKPNQKVAVENVEIKGIPTYHDDETGIGFLLYTSKFVLGYTSDTSWHKDLISHYKQADVLICNVPYPNNEKGNGLNVQEAIRLVSGTNPALAVITHFGKSMISEDPLGQAREIQKATGVQVIAAQDGQRIVPDTYSAKMRQKTLNVYNEQKKLYDTDEDETYKTPGA